MLYLGIHSASGTAICCTQSLFWRCSPWLLPWRQPRPAPTPAPCPDESLAPQPTPCPGPLASPTPRPAPQRPGRRPARVQADALPALRGFFSGADARAYMDAMGLLRLLATNPGADQSASLEMIESQAQFFIQTGAAQKDKNKVCQGVGFARAARLLRDQVRAAAPGPAATAPDADSEGALPGGGGGRGSEGGAQ